MEVVEVFEHLAQNNGNVILVAWPRLDLHTAIHQQQARADGRHRRTAPGSEFNGNKRDQGPSRRPDTP